MKEFDKVVGYEDVKIELERIVDMMVNPEKYRKLGVKTTRGLLLVGEPGVGKTLMAKCLIDACKVKSFTLRKNAPDGDFVKLISETFKTAKENAPSIVFLDDVDKFANGDRHHKNEEEFVTIQSCIDDCKDDEVFVIATANELDNLPDSLLRPGRFDKNIEIPNPTGKDAELISKHYLSSKKIADDIDYKEVAKLLDGRSCASLETVINEAGVYAGYEGHELITMKDVVRAFMRVVYDAPEAVSQKESKFLRNTAVHEAGHTVASEILEPESVNIVSIKMHNGNVGGFTSYVNNEDYFASMKFMENRVIALLAGKAATELVYGQVDTGANNDLHRAFRIVGRFIDDYCAYGFQGWEGCTDMASSPVLLERKTQMIQHEMSRYYNLAKELIASNREFLDKVTDSLVENTTLSFRDIQNIKKDCGITTTI